MLSLLDESAFFVSSECPSLGISKEKAFAGNVEF